MKPQVRSVTVTAAARNFADIVNRAFYRNETTVLVKNGVPVAHVAPVSPAGSSAREALARWRLVPRLGRKEAEALARDIETELGAIPPLRSPWD